MSDMKGFEVPVRKLNVLIVDDSRAMQGVISSVLNELGIRLCRCVSSGEDALSLVRQDISAFHVLFIDLNMPGMDGMQLIHELANVRYTGGIIILSELDMKIIKLAGEVTKKHRARLIGCLSKPVTQDKILPIIQKLKTLHSFANKKSQLISVEDIRKSISENWLTPYYQPLVNNQNGNIPYLEILARIDKPGERNGILPERFIETAEREGLIEQVTLHILEYALKEYPVIIEEFGVDCKLALNISPVLLNNHDFPDRLNKIIEDEGFKAKNIILEITENRAVDQTLQLETLNRVRIKGFSLALDDYGTGFTNIQQLKNLPYTEIKIDRSLIYGICDDKLSQVVANSLLGIFSELDVNVVAEGVETKGDLDYLNKLPIAVQLQGYIISKPKSLDNILRWHHGWKKVIKP